MLTQAISEKILEENITHAVLDQCLTATFSLLYYEKYRSTEDIGIKIDTASAIIQIVKRSDNQEIYLYDLGRDFILKAKKNLSVLIHVYRTSPEKFLVLQSFALTNQIDNYYAMLNTIDVSSINADEKEEGSRRMAVEWQARKESFESGRYCPACQAAPCMCSDPQWHW